MMKFRYDVCSKDANAVLLKIYHQLLECKKIKTICQVVFYNFLSAYYLFTVLVFGFITITASNFSLMYYPSICTAEASNYQSIEELLRAANYIQVKQIDKNDRLFKLTLKRDKILTPSENLQKI
ncbi:hypothetical protein J7K93_13650 [bacterium]|nr:hypothetical protein [bacterium]